MGEAVCEVEVGDSVPEVGVDVLGDFYGLKDVACSNRIRRLFKGRNHVLIHCN